MIRGEDQAVILVNIHRKLSGPLSFQLMTSRRRQMGYFGQSFAAYNSMRRWLSLGASFPYAFCMAAFWEHVLHNFPDLKEISTRSSLVELLTYYVNNCLSFRGKNAKIFYKLIN